MTLNEKRRIETNRIMKAAVKQVDDTSSIKRRTVKDTEGGGLRWVRIIVAAIVGLGALLYYYT